MNEITYSKIGNYFLPDLVLPAEKDKFIFGKYGRLRKDYLKNHRIGFYSRLVFSCTLNEHLSEIDTQAKEMLENIMQKLAAKENVTEQLKTENQMAWVGALNSIKNRAEEIVFDEVIFR